MTAHPSRPDLIAACPFCGSTDAEILTSSIGLFWGKCAGCGAEGPVKNFRFAATEAWNTRPAAPATDAEGERLREAAKTVLEWYDRDGSVGTADEAMEPLREALARPASAPQAVEELRREAAEDERDRLYAAADAEIEVFASFASKEVRRFLWQMGAMLPADRQRARAGQNGGT